MQSWFNNQNVIHIITSTDTEKEPDKIQHSLMIFKKKKLSENQELKGKFFDLIKDILKQKKQNWAKSYLTLSTFFLGSEQDKDIPSCHFYSTLRWRSKLRQAKR